MDSFFVSLVKFRTGYVDDNGEEVLDPKECALHTRRRGSALLRSPALLPAVLVGASVSIKGGQDPEARTSSRPSRFSG